MGGSITVKSQDHKGSTFSFLVPLELDEVSELKHQTQRLRLSQLQQKILVIDNHQRSCRVLCDQLRGLGFEPHCMDLYSSLNHFRSGSNNHFQVSIVDNILLGRIQEELGVEVFQNVYKDLKLILLKPVQQTIRLQELGVRFCACISRPIRQSYLRDALCKAFGSSVAVLQELSNNPDYSVCTEARKPCILVVEDNKVNQMVAMRLLGKLGCLVDVACNGKEAIALLDRACKYDLIFMDCHMPVLDGFETARLIRKQNTVPIVALTAATMDGELEKCMQSGMNDYVSKPCTKGDLNRVLHKWLVP